MMEDKSAYSHFWTYWYRYWAYFEHILSYRYYSRLSLSHSNSKSNRPWITLDTRMACSRIFRQWKSYGCECWADLGPLSDSRRLQCTSWWWKSWSLKKEKNYCQKIVEMQKCYVMKFISKIELKKLKTKQREMWRYLDTFSR